MGKVEIGELSVDALKRIGVKGQGRQAEEAARLALRVLGMLADASSQEVRRQALEKARRMLAIR